MPAAFPSSPPTIPTAPFTAEMRDALRAIVGEKGFIEDEHGKQPFVTDWRGLLVGGAGAVVRPGSTEEVSKVVRLCHEQGVAIVPQGGNTGLMGGATPWPAHNGIVLSLGRMNRILEVDPVGYSMTVEAGCVLQTLQETAASHDRFLPLSLGAQGSCMIGGNLSTNAGGVQVLRYGNARNLVLGLEVVLANGDVWDGLRALKKDNTGYDLKHLFMGAEGTLGIITKAVLKLWPAPKDVCTAWLAIRDPRAALEILSEAHAASEDNVGSCELMSRSAIDMVLRHIPGTQDPLKADTPWYLLLEWSSARPRRDGTEGMSEKMQQFLADQLEAGRVLDATIAHTISQSRNMWRIREGVAEASRAEGPGLSYDVSVAISRIPEFIDKGLKAVLGILPTIRPYPLGHIGDGNLHFSFMGPKGMDQQTLIQYKGAITRAVNDLITSMGGSISAEHGIGIDKLDELSHYRSKTELDIMRTIKRALDPQNIMNPGKVLRL
ncbi:FAD-binding oxidoreductase [Bradyrhizobium zhanjiangense]|uniref:FAD-binding oxidoreductase n=1 Tax=Bradyrhizobium zhanjiangense TaxID=1325107 RepID=A0ABY0DRE3_9BRAD|nr:FAD-binding oxidoreductase [Bradyrhizobium zhanjiangense]RXG98509.1 FAD-binding oxidoreductase [Bradyrhizobium zhanjiangense]